MQIEPTGPWLTLLVRLAVIPELASPMAAANATHAYHLLLTGINKNLIWENYEKPTHYAIWFMFWHVAIIGLIAEKASFPELYGPAFQSQTQPEPLASPCVWSSNCLKTSLQVCWGVLRAPGSAEVWWTRASRSAVRSGTRLLQETEFGAVYPEHSPQHPAPRPHSTLTCSWWPLQTL